MLCAQWKNTHKPPSPVVKRIRPMITTVYLPLFTDYSRVTDICTRVLFISQTKLKLSCDSFWRSLKCHYSLVVQAGQPDPGSRGAGVLVVQAGQPDPGSRGAGLLSKLDNLILDLEGQVYCSQVIHLLTSRDRKNLFVTTLTFQMVCNTLHAKCAFVNTTCLFNGEVLSEFNAV